METFYARHLGGRYQTEVPADVAAKLAEITVDPKTVSGAVTMKRPPEGGSGKPPPAGN